MRADCGRRNAPEPAAFRRGSLDKSQSRRRPSSRGQPPITAHCGAGQGGTACGPLWRCRVWLGSLSISVRACLSPAVGAKEDGHPAPALLLAARCLLTTLGWAGWSKFSFTSVDEQRKPQISTVRILANQGHIILRLVPIITNNSGLAPSAPPPSDQRTIANPLQSRYLRRLVFSHCPCHSESTQTLRITLPQITSSSVTYEHHFLGAVFFLCSCSQSPQHCLLPSSLRCL